MDFSKLKLEVYDLLGLVLPGFLLVCEGWILFRGWHAFLLVLDQVTGTGLTLLLLVSFGAGNVVQELGDFTIKRIKGNRYLRRARDRFWESAEAELVKNAMKADLGHPITSADTAFDYCLTKIGDLFGKRDLFVATSDLCRSFAVLSLVALASAFWNEFRTFGLSEKFFGWAFGSLLACGILFALSWRRMVRFRELSDITVFHVYLATVVESKEKHSTRIGAPLRRKLHNDFLEDKE